MKKDLTKEYQTPPAICNYMVSLLEDDDITNVLEPTPGEGNLVTALESMSFKVDAPLDYFLVRNIILKTHYDAVACNLPFSFDSAILDNAPDHYVSEVGMKFGYKMLFEMMNISNRVVALVPWFTIVDSDVRMRFIKKFGLKSITALPRRTFDYVRIQTCILDMEKGYKGETEFKVYDLLTENKFNKSELGL